MNLHDYLTVLRGSWLVITVSTALGLLLGLGASVLATPLFQSSSQLFVSITDSSRDGVYGAYTGALFAQEQIKSYTSIVDTPAVLEPVIEDLGLDTTPGALGGQVSAVNATQTVLIDVSATDTDPEMAAAIADATAKSLAAQITRLETPTGADASPVKVSVIRPAAVNDFPISPRTTLNLALGGLLGLMIGVGIAVLRHTLDTTVKTSDDLVEATGATALGAIGYDPTARTAPLVALDQTAVRAEAFRTLRTNLRYVDVDHPPRCVVLTSSVPSEGKSTSACNLAIAMAQAGSRVLLVEADLRRPRIADYLGLAGGVGLTDVLIGQMSAADAVVSWTRGLLDVLPSGPIPPNPSELLGSHQMRQLLDELSRTYDVILLDAPPLLPVTDAAVLASIADGAVVLARYGRTRREQLAHAADALAQANARLLGVVMNFVPSRGSRSGYGYGYGYGYGGYGSDYSDGKSPRGRMTVEDLLSSGPAPGSGSAPVANGRGAVPHAGSGPAVAGPGETS